MKKIYIEEYGTIDVLKEKSEVIPKPTDSQIQIKLVSTSINDPDIVIRKHGPFPTMPKEMRPVLPHMLGEDFGGIVTEVGKNVKRFKVGDHVIGLNMKGTYAEYICIEENSLAITVPKELDLVPLGGIYVTAATAWAAVVNNGKVKKGDRVLIHGAAGGVGSFAVQIAKNIGAHVITSAGKHSFDYLRSLGADELLDYKTQDFTKIVKDVDVVINLTGQKTLDQSYQVVKKGGMLTSTNGMPDENKGKEFGINVKYTMGIISLDDMGKVVKLYGDGKLKINVMKTYKFTLEDIKLAHTEFEKGPNQGKRIIVFS